ncbi:MAG: alpha/beta fold hydrolase [Clostridia bacterium]|nr:alpha/beta fold hydrolase [Clostridia bacterium]
MDIALPILIVAFCILALVLLAAFVCYRMTFARNKNTPDDPYASMRLAGFDEFNPIMEPLINEISATPCEDIYIKSHDGVTLYARYYHNKDGAPVEIQMHGYRGHALRDFCGGARDARGRGHNLILVDQRAHGKSEGGSITFGIKERYDCLDFINYAIERFGKKTKIIILGMSMGAATVLMASGLDLPKNVKAIMADCPYSSPRDIISSVISKMGLPARLFFPLVRLGGMIFGGFDVCSAEAKEAVKSSQIPTIILHGEADSFVPCYMSREIFENCKMKKRMLVTFPGAEHGVSYLCDKDRYLGAVESFMEEALSDDEN